MINFLGMCAGLLLIFFAITRRDDAVGRVKQQINQFPTLIRSVLIVVMLPMLLLVWSASIFKGTSYPPKLAEFLLSAFGPENAGESMIGDLAEKFAEDMQKYGSRRATWLYWLDTLRSIAPMLIARLRNWGIFAALLEFSRRKIGW